MEEGSGGNNSKHWTAKYRKKNKKVRQRWTSFQKGKTYEEIYGYDKAAKIKSMISESGKGRKLNLSDNERKRRSDQMINSNPGKKVSNKTIKKRVKTFKSKSNNIGNKNGMNTKPESRMIIADKNSRIHILENVITKEIIKVKNITKWAKEQGLNPKSVLVWFCKGKTVNNWTRLESISATEIRQQIGL